MFSYTSECPFPPREMAFTLSQLSLFHRRIPEKTEFKELRKFLRTFNEGSFDEGDTLDAFIDSSVHFFSASEREKIADQLFDYLNSNPSDYQIMQFWESCNRLVAFRSAAGLQMFFKTILLRLKLHSVRR